MRCRCCITISLKSPITSQREKPGFATPGPFSFWRADAERILGRYLLLTVLIVGLVVHPQRVESQSRGDESTQSPRLIGLTTGLESWGGPRKGPIEFHPSGAGSGTGSLD